MDRHIPHNYITIVTNKFPMYCKLRNQLPVGYTEHYLTMLTIKFPIRLSILPHNGNKEAVYLLKSTLYIQMVTNQWPLFCKLSIVRCKMISLGNILAGCPL